MTRCLRLALAACLAVAARADEYFTGDMTAYTLGSTSAGNCNFMSAASDAATDYAALNDPQWAGTKNCGRCALVQCTDSRCPDPSKTKLVYILDRCPECKQGDLDVSPSVFAALTGSNPSRYTIKWKFVDCPVTGNIKYCLKSGSNAFWTAVQPSNTVTGVASMTINAQTTSMVDSAYYYLLNGQSTTQTDLSSVRVTLTSVGGESITDTVSLTAGSCTEGSHQFSRGTAPQPQPAPAPAPAAAPAPTSAPTPSPVVTPTPTTAPVATTTPSPVQTTASPTPSVSPSSTPSVAQSAGSVGGEASSGAGQTQVDTRPGIVRAPDDSTMSSREAESKVAKATDEAGVLDSTETTPTPGTTSPTTNAGGSGTAGGATQANTRSGAAGGTSPAVLILSVMGVMGVIALTVVAIMVRRKRVKEKEDDRDHSMMVVNLRSFDTPEAQANML